MDKSKILRGLGVAAMVVLPFGFVVGGAYFIIKKRIANASREDQQPETEGQ